MQKREKIQKLLIIIISITLFGISYSYYLFKDKNLSKKPEQVVISKKITIPDEKQQVSPDTEASSDESSDEEKELNDEADQKEVSKKEDSLIIEDKKIQPTDKTNLITMASNISGKNDPFSYKESKFTPINSTKTSDRGSYSSTNPVKPTNYVEIRGFIGNKVIAEVNGFTDSLKEGETLKGVKILTIDPVNLSCELEVKGKKITKSIQPIIK